MNPSFWKNRRVFLTGHTGFKGTWLALWLAKHGARVTGYALAPDTTPNMWSAATPVAAVDSIIADVRDAEALRNALANSNAEVVFHLAAQPLVRESYARPVDTYATNVMGTVHLLDACRDVASVRAVVVVTTDKVYENRDWVWPYREIDRLGGRDPYSNSKACAELVTSAYRASFFHDGAAVATARAGNVIGGGDWAQDRLVPDLLRAFAAGESALIRNPGAVRPWQHVLEPLHGYLLLAEGLWERRELADAWNFGPYEHDVRPVRAVADALAAQWGGGASWHTEETNGPHEAMLLRLDSSRARTVLGWQPKLTIDTALEWIVEWHRRFENAPQSALDITFEQIERYEALTV